MSGEWIRYGSPGLTEVTNGLMFGLPKVRSALEMRKYITLAGPVSFIDSVIIGSCGVGPVSERCRSVSQFGPWKKLLFYPRSGTCPVSLSVGF
jgi:hypothetical protein